MKKELKIILTLVLCIVYIFSIQIKAQKDRFNDGDIDTSFGNNGFVVTGLEPNESDNYLNDFVLQPDGKIIAVGASSSLNYTRGILLIRYNADGSLDSTFGTNGKVTYQRSFAFQTHACSVAVQSDGKIVVAGAKFGSSNEYYNFADGVVVRYNPDGSLDTGFGQNGIVIVDFALIEGYSTDIFYKVLLQSDGKIVAVGKSTEVYFNDIGDSYISLVRLNQDGSFDEKFGNSGKVKTLVGLDAGNSLMLYDVLDAEIQADGKIIAGTSPRRKRIPPNGLDGASVSLIVRYNNDGTLDTDLSNGGILTYGRGVSFQSIRLRTNGKIIALSSYFQLNQFSYNGNIDFKFGSNAAAFPSILFNVEGFAIANDGKIVICGYKQRQNLGSTATLYRRNVNGSFDSSFGTDGLVSLEIAGQSLGFSRVILQPDGKILAAGSTYSNTGGYNNRFLIARFLVNNQIKATSKSKN